MRGLLGSEEKLWERIIMDSEGEELQDRRVVSLIAFSEMYKSSSS